MCNKDIMMLLILLAFFAGYIASQRVESYFLGDNFKIKQCRCNQAP